MGGVHVTFIDTSLPFLLKSLRDVNHEVLVDILSAVFSITEGASDLALQFQKINTTLEVSKSLIPVKNVVVVSWKEYMPQSMLQTT